IIDYMRAHIIHITVELSSSIFPCVFCAAFETSPLNFYACLDRRERPPRGGTMPKVLGWPALLKRSHSDHSHLITPRACAADYPRRRRLAPGMRHDPEPAI